MKEKDGMENMAGKIPVDSDPSHDFAQPVNPDAQGAAMGATVLHQEASFRKSTQNKD